MTPIKLMVPSKRRETAKCYPLLQDVLGNTKNVSDREQKDEVVCSIVGATFGYAYRSSTGQNHLRFVYFYLTALATPC